MHKKIHIPLHLLVVATFCCNWHDRLLSRSNDNGSLLRARDISRFQSIPMTPFSGYCVLIVAFKIIR